MRARRPASARGLPEERPEERACIPLRPQGGGKRMQTFAHRRFDRSSVTRHFSRNLASQPNVKTRALQQIEMLSASRRAGLLSPSLWPLGPTWLKMPRGLSPSSPPTLLGPPRNKCPKCGVRRRRRRPPQCRISGCERQTRCSRWPREEYVILPLRGEHNKQWLLFLTQFCV